MSLYVDGEWTAAGGPARPVVNPATEEAIAHVADASAEDVDAAVEAARTSFEGWQRTPLDERIAHVERVRDGIVERLDEIGRTIAEDVGTMLSAATMMEAGAAAMCIDAYAEVARELPWEEELGASVVVREPVGVAAAITPWNFPFSEPLGKVVPALVAGCTVVLKPSEVAPLAAFLLAEVVDEAELPPGVFNLVAGGAEVGELLAAHAEVDAISFTGSTATGRRVAELGAQTLKRLTLELGGKSACIVLDDADLQPAVREAVSQCFLNAGQMCIAWSRLLVPRSAHDEAAAIAAEAAERHVLGDPLADVGTMGPLASAAQRDRVRSYIRRGIEEGATLVAGGDDPPEGLDRGYYVRPTVFANVDNSMAIAREEIFGPVLAILPYENEEDAIRIANDSIYGLHGAVFSGDRERAERVARRLRTGGVAVNGGSFDLLAPVGGYKQSGYGREMGRAGLEAFLELKAIQIGA